MNLIFLENIITLKIFVIFFFIFHECAQPTQGFPYIGCIYNWNNISKFSSLYQEID